MPAITVKSAKIAKQGGTDVVTLRVVVDRSLASVGGPAAGVVASGAVTQDAGTFTLPQLTLYSTYNAADLITREAIYRAELLDGAGNVVSVLTGFEAFQIRVISAQTTWNEIREQNDWYSLIQGADSTKLGNDSTPSLGNSVVTVLGALTDPSADTISLFFGKGINPPGLRRNVATAQMEYSHDGQTWAAIGSGGGGGITGNGTVQYLALFTAGTVIGDSQVFYDAVNQITFVQNNFQVEENVIFGGDQVIINSNPVRAINVPLVRFKNVVGQTAAVIQLDNSANGGAIQQILRADGNLWPKGVTTNWPVSNSAGYLINDGVGNLSWSPAAGTYSWLVQADSGLAQAVPNNQAVKWVGGNGIVTSLSLGTFLLTIDVDLLSTGGLQVSGGANQLGIKLDTVTGGGNNAAVLSADGLYVPPGGGGGGTGTVTSVGLSLPSIFNVSGSPVTSSGTLTGTLANQNPNLFFAGPASGGAATPTFRAIVAADLPVFVGDSGAGGTKGAVPAPAAGDAAAQKFLKADGTWSAVTAGGNVFYQGNSGGIGTYIIGAPGEVLTIDGGAGLVSVTIPLSDTIRIDVDLAPTQAAGPNIASIVSNQLYVTPRQYVRVRLTAVNDAIIPASDNVLIVDTSGGNRAITLTTPIAGEFRDFYIKKQTTDANTITLTPASGQIDGGASFVFSGTFGTSGECVHVVFDGTNWWVVSRT